MTPEEYKMTSRQFEDLLHYLLINHEELFLKFPHIYLSEGSFFIFKPAGISEEEYSEILSISNKWREDNKQ